jgi:hypothetical protein
MKASRVIEKCKSLDEFTQFSCKVDSYKQAMHIMFRLQEHFLGKVEYVTTWKAGRRYTSCEMDFPGCIADYQEGVFKFQRSKNPICFESSTVERISRPRKVLTPKEFDIEKNTTKLDYSSRGGGIEITLEDLGYPDMKMTAFQNYLGGGMLGSISSDCGALGEDGRMYRFHGWQDDPVLVEISEKLQRYFHGLTNPDDDEWASDTFEGVQNRAYSAY